MLKHILISVLIIAFGVPAPAQKPAPIKNVDYAAYGQMIYWKALTREEKKVFLHAYLYRTHEIEKELQASRKLKSVTPRYQTEIAEPLFAIFRNLDENGKNDLIDWIDTFYQHEHNHKESFHKALRYAYRKLQTGAETMHDVYRRTYPE